MIVSATQRWRGGRASYRPAGETIPTHRYDVEELASDTEARAFVVAHHYSRSYPAARRRFALRRGAELVGVAVFSVPTNPRTLSCLPEPTSSADLGRFVLLDDVEANGETWFLGRCFERLRREGFTGVVSFSDPMVRTTAAGVQLSPGHVGTIYQAHNACFLGRAKRDTLHLLPDGQVFSSRAMAKIRRRDRGWRYAAAQLEAVGATPLTDDEDAAAWLARWLPQLRRVRHPGNFKYAWTLARRDRKHLPASLPYPKVVRP